MFFQRAPAGQARRQRQNGAPWQIRGKTGWPSCSELGDAGQARAALVLNRPPQFKRQCNACNHKQWLALAQHVHTPDFASGTGIPRGSALQADDTSCPFRRAHKPAMYDCDVCSASRTPRSTTASVARRTAGCNLPRRKLPVEREPAATERLDASCMSQEACAKTSQHRRPSTGSAVRPVAETGLLAAEALHQLRAAMRTTQDHQNRALRQNRCNTETMLFA